MIFLLSSKKYQYQYRYVLYSYDVTASLYMEYSTFSRSLLFTLVRSTRNSTGTTVRLLYDSNTRDGCLYFACLAPAVTVVSCCIMSSTLPWKVMVYTVDEMMEIGLRLEGATIERLRRQQRKTQIDEFKGCFGNQPAPWTGNGTQSSRHSGMRLPWIVWGVGKIFLCGTAGGWIWLTVMMVCGVRCRFCCELVYCTGSYSYCALHNTLRTPCIYSTYEK